MTTSTPEPTSVSGGTVVVAATPPAAADPVAAGEAEGGGGELGQDVQPEIAGVQPELARQACGRLVLDPGTVVLDVLEQG